MPILGKREEGHPVLRPLKLRGPASYGADESVVSQLKQYRVTDLRSATSASAGLDLAVATEVVLNTLKEIKVVSTGICGPLPKGMVGLILGHSSTSKQGILVLPGVIDSDYRPVWLSRSAARTTSCSASFISILGSRFKPSSLR